MKKLLRVISLNDAQGKEKIKLLKIDLRAKYKELRRLQKISKEIRKAHLNELAIKRARQWNIPASKAALVIKEAEESREMHKRHRRFLKPSTGGGIKSVLVPKPVSNWIPAESDITTTECQTKVSDPNEVFNVLLRQNFTQLQKSKDSPFASGPIFEQLNKNDGSNVIENILKGMDKELKNQLSQMHTNKNIMERFLNAIATPTNKEGIKTKPFQWEYGLKEYKETFSKTRESTACGPSGLHMSHWKAAVDRDRIAELHAFIIWAAFQFSIVYKRWETSWHVMLQKKKQPFSQKLRIIQLFEGDFNGGLKYLLGRKLMWHATEEGIMDTDTYGSRTGRTAPEAVVNLQLIFDDSRLWKKNIGMLFNDADGCYDRIAPLLGEIAVRRIGCPPEIAKTVTETLKEMKHFVKTSVGISPGYINYSTESKTIIEEGVIKCLNGIIGGSGQGSGASPIIWLAILLIMIKVYKENNTGVNIHNPITKEAIKYWILSYVDDNTIVRNFKSNTTTEEILDSLGKSLLEWNELLNITGGALSLNKCKVSILTWRANYWGIKNPDSGKEDETIYIPSETTGNRKDPLERISPCNAERILGLRLPILGTMNSELEYRIKQMDILARKLYQAPISHKEAFLIYQTRYKPMVKYCFPVTTFNREELDKIQKKFIFLLLPKLGMNRHTPRDVIYGPTSRGGRGLMDIRLEQPVIHIETTISHMRRGDNAGKSLKATLNGHQIVAGTSTPFLDVEPNDLPYLPPNSRWAYIWKTSKQYGFTLEVADQWTPAPRCTNDKVLMDVAIKDEYYKKKKWKLEIINNCRLYLRVFSLSEMACSDDEIRESYINGTTRNRYSRITFEDVDRPPQSAWNEWRQFLFRNFLKGNKKLQHPLNLDNTNRHPTATINTTLHIVKQNTIKETISKLPITLQEILQSIQIPSDEGRKLAESLATGSLLGASDGSLTGKGDGGYAFSLQKWDNDEGRITGKGKAPCSNELSSLTVESYGMLGTLGIILLLCSQYEQFLHVNEMKGCITVTTDNKEVVERINNEAKPFNLKETQVPDYDLWVLMWEFKKIIPTHVKGKWIRGHQDTTKDGQMIYGPFPREVEVNIKMDELANEARTDQSLVQIKRRTYKGTVLGMYDERGTMITNLRDFLYNNINGTQMKTYIQNKFNWDDLEQSMIAWDELSKSLAKYTEFKKSKIVQMMYNWQNDGEQKTTFHQSAQGECPAQCGEPETHHHYLTCQAPSMKKSRESQIRILKQYLTIRNTHPHIINTTIRYLREGAESTIHHLGDPTNGIEKLVYDGVKENLHLNQHSFEKGFISQKWMQAQQEWSRITQPTKKYNQQQWGRDFVMGI